MSNTLEKWRKEEVALQAERRLMNEALAMLGRPGTRMTEARGPARLIFGLDLTGSREPGLKQARIATAAMFDAIKAIGKVFVKLVYYRGFDQCHESGWHDDPAILSKSMLSLSCEVGGTQIGRLLNRAMVEPEKLAGVVFIGDHCEENPDELASLAAQLGKKSIPIFVFHECADKDEHSLSAKPTFKRLAEASGGVYVEFKSDSGAVLKELMANVAAFSTGGMKSVERLALPSTAEARQLRGSLRLMLGPGGDIERR